MPPPPPLPSPPLPPNKLEMTWAKELNFASTCFSERPFPPLFIQLSAVLPRAPAKRGHSVAATLYPTMLFYFASGIPKFRTHYFFNWLCHHFPLQYSDTALYNQVLYYARLFDVKHVLKSCKSDMERSEWAPCCVDCTQSLSFLLVVERLERARCTTARATRLEWAR